MKVMIPKTSSSTVSSRCDLENIGGTCGDSISGGIKMEGKVVSSGSGKEDRDENDEASEEDWREGLVVDALGVDWRPILL
jgi:hypothetical protein